MEQHDRPRAGRSPASSWLDNLRTYETGTTVHPQIYSCDLLRGSPAYSYSVATRVKLADGGAVTCSHRAPGIDFSKPYACCIGGAQTFGRGVVAPFPELLGDAVTGLQIANLGYGGAGPEFYLGIPEYIELCRRSAFVVLQIMSARSCSTPRYRVIWGNRGLDTATGQRTTYPRFFHTLRETRPDECQDFIRETQRAYVAEMLRLIEAIERPVYLLWISRRSPEESLLPGDPGDFPHLVDRECVESLKQHADGYIEVLASRSEVALYYPGQGLHQRIFERLLEALTCNRVVTVRPDFDIHRSRERAKELEWTSRLLLAGIGEKLLGTNSVSAVTNGHRPPPLSAA